MRLLRKIPRTVLLLGLASLFTDIASEGTFSILFLFLTQALGAGPFYLGVIEGTAESTASLLKVFSGFWADRLRRRKPLILWGYGLSGFFRPFIALARAWPAVLCFRFIDRVGKGLRSSPRDALIADAALAGNRGALYGFHSSMDNAGALLGPLLASLLIYSSSWGFRKIIGFSILPGVAAVLCLALVREKPRKDPVGKRPPDWAGGWRRFGPDFKFLLLVLLIFTLGNSTDAFLLVRLSQVGVPVPAIPLMWGLHSGIRTLASMRGGGWSDRWGRKPVIAAGWIYYAAVYLAFALVSDKWAVGAVFLAYGLFHGLCEPSEKALVADLAPPALRGTAFGYYNLTAGLGMLPASLVFGWIGGRWGYPDAFGAGAAFAGLASILLLWVKTPKTAF
jgi:MFS family permease